MSAPSLSDFTSPYELSPSFSVGEEAGRVRTVFTEMQEHAHVSLSLGAAKKEALESLYETFTECCRTGWDGYEGETASYESYCRAKRFIEALPANFPAPEVALDPDGEVSLEWYCGPGRVFSVSVGADEELTYAGKFSPSKKTHGTEPFIGQIPKVILDNIRRLLA